MGSTAFILRHINRRKAAAEAEVQRRALLSVARNTTLPAHVRHKAQLTLSQHNGGTINGRMNSVVNLCNETGRGRGVLSKYGLCRVSLRDQKRASGAAERNAPRRGVCNVGRLKQEEEMAVRVEGTKGRRSRRGTRLCGSEIVSTHGHLQ